MILMMLMMISYGATFPCSSCGRDVGFGDLPSYHPIKCTSYVVHGHDGREEDDDDDDDDGDENGHDDDWLGRLSLHHPIKCTWS